MGHSDDMWRVGLGSPTVTGLTLAMVLALGASPVSAAYDPDNMIPSFGFTSNCENTTSTGYKQPCQTDNGQISVYMQASVTTHMRGLIHDSLDNSYDPIAELSVTYVASPTYSGATETDIIYQQAAISGTTIGTCSGRTTSRR